MTLSLLAVSSGLAQIVAYDDEQLTIGLGAEPETLEMNWFGHSGRAYFLMYSPTLDTGSWAYLPIVERGTNATLSYGASTPGAGDRSFFRTVITTSASTQPKFEDFDNDGVSNMDELQAGLNPLSWADTDLDGMPDDWERFYFGNLDRNGTEDFDGDGVSDADEYTAHRHPNTNIVYGGTVFRWAGENSGTVFFSDSKSESTIVVTYSDAAQTRITTLQFYLDYNYYDFLYESWDPIYYPKPDPLVEYTNSTGIHEPETFVFTGNTASSYYIERTGRDLLRSIDGRPYSRVIAGGAVKRIASYRAITSLPLIVVNGTSFPAIIRDFPYEDPKYPDFANGRNGGSTGLIQAQLGSDGLPAFAPTDIDTSRHIESSVTFAQWFHEPSALTYSLHSETGFSFPSGYVSGFRDSSFHPHVNDTGYYYGSYSFTAEFHGKLHYDLATTVFRFSSDDDLWVFINGKLVWDKGGIHGGSQEVKLLSELSHNLTSATGIADIDVFYSERQRSGAELELISSSLITPVYAYQVISEGMANIATSTDYSLSVKPFGMTISQTGKILWDYSGVTAGTYEVIVDIADAKGNVDSQAFTVTIE